MKAVQLYRVRMNKLGLLPKGFREGAIVGFTKDEHDQLKRQPQGIADCFEAVTLDLGPAHKEEKKEGAPA